jgi:Ca2+-binding RTX toxin-like protein
MTGGAGIDTFVFHDGDFGGATTSTADRIIDFTTGEDKIDLNTVDANTLVAGDQSFAFVGTNAFSHTAGELRYEQISGNTYVEGDMNGDGIADFMIKLDGLHALTGTDIVP